MQRFSIRVSINKHLLEGGNLRLAGRVLESERLELALDAVMLNNVVPSMPATAGWEGVALYDYVLSWLIAL